MSGARHPGELIVHHMCERSLLVPTAARRFRIRAMPQAISENRVRFASKALKMFMLQVHAT
jgi:hypothetical protein